MRARVVGGGGAGKNFVGLRKALALARQRAIDDRMQQDSRLPVPAAGDGGAPLVPFFRDISAPLITAARRLKAVVSDPSQRDAGCAEIKSLEAAADALARAAV